MQTAPLIALATAPVVLFSAVTFGAAQPNEYRLDPSGRLQQIERPAPGTPAGRIAEARRQLAEDRPEQAQRILSEFIDEFDRPGNEYLPEAYLLRGDARLAMDREFSALYDYEAVLTRFRQSDQFPVAVSRELEIALRYAAGLRIRTLGFRIADSSDVAVELLIRVQERMPKSDLAERASISLADFYYERREMKLASTSYDLYLQNFPNGPNRIKAMKRRIQTDIARFKGPRYDASGLLDARVRLNDFIARFPGEASESGLNEALLVRVDESIAAQELDTAEWYLRTGDEASARFALTRLRRDHPQSIAAQRAETIMTERGWIAPVVAPELPAAPEPAPESETAEDEPAE